MSAVFRATAWMFLMAGIAASAYAQEESGSTLAEQCEAVCQDRNAPWRSVSWETDLLNAQKMSVEQHKPLFVWAMDGHPLGCT